jgi:hypothetical protein
MAARIDRLVSSRGVLTKPRRALTFDGFEIKRMVAVAHTAEAAVEKYIHRENLALFKKRLAFRDFGQLWNFFVNPKFFP